MNRDQLDQLLPHLHPTTSIWVNSQTTGQCVIKAHHGSVLKRCRVGLKHFAPKSFLSLLVIIIIILNFIKRTCIEVLKSAVQLKKIKRVKICKKGRK